MSKAHIIESFVVRLQRKDFPSENFFGSDFLSNVKSMVTKKVGVRKLWSLMQVSVKLYLMKQNFLFCTVNFL